MAIKPVLHRIIVKPDVLEEVDPVYASAKRAGIELVKKDDLKREQAGVDKGTVLSIGPTAFRDFGSEFEIKPGDRIAYARYAGKYIEDPETGVEVLAINDEDCIAILTLGEAQNA